MKSNGSATERFFPNGLQRAFEGTCSARLLVWRELAGERLALGPGSFDRTDNGFDAAEFFAQPLHRGGEIRASGALQAGWERVLGLRRDRSRVIVGSVTQSRQFRGGEFECRRPVRGQGSIACELRDEGPGLRDVKDIQEAMRDKLPKSARATIGFEGGNGMGGGNEEGVRVSLVGDSAETLKEISVAIVEVLSEHKELRDVRVDTGDENSELAVSVDRERAGRYGFAAQEDRKSVV